MWSSKSIVPIWVRTVTRRSSSRIRAAQSALDNWDKTPISLPFGRMGLVRGAEIRVPRDADDAALEATRIEVEKALNDVTERAYALARNGRA